jgi:molybdopterin-containing oxidoreductase family iron-sulfur binding subunit
MLDMPPLNDEPSTPASAGYWRSLEQLAGSPEYRAAAQLTDKEYEARGERFLAEGIDPVTRRRFLQLTGASAALAGLAGCQTQDKVLPFAADSADHAPGHPKFFATATELGGFAKSLMVTSYDGRPIKVEGNPHHPFLGAADRKIGPADIHSLAGTLDLYDPDRSKAAVLTEANGRTVDKNFNDFLSDAGPRFAELRKKKGAGLRVLSEASSSVTLAGLKARFAKAFPEAVWVEYEPVSRDNVRAGTMLAYGKAYRPQLDLAKADVILTLDDDLLVGHPAALRYAREYAAGRKPTAGKTGKLKMNRLYAVESLFSGTGSVADHRLPLRSEQIAPFAAALAHAVSAKGAEGGLKAAGEKPEGGKGGFLHAEGVAKFLAALADDLLAHKGACVVTAGPRQPAEVHALAAWLNAALGNVGKTVTYTPEEPRPSHNQAIAALAADLKKGVVTHLVVLGGNPAYNTPADLEFAKLLRPEKGDGKGLYTVHLSDRRDETSILCTWHLPRAHWLEAWGDARAYDGTLSIVQPLIEPLYGGKSDIELVAALLGEQPNTGYELVRAALLPTFSADPQAAETAWRKALHDGFVAGTAFKAESPRYLGHPVLDRLTFADRQLAADLPPENNNLEIVFAADPKLYDGRFANNGWLQELPDHLTKLTWDNAVLVSPRTAARFHVENATLARLTYRGRMLRAAVYTLPGHADGSVTVLLGYGRTHAGQVGGLVDGPDEKKAAPVGFDTYKLRDSAAPDFDAGLQLTPTHEPYELATTQDHHAIDEIGESGRDARVPTLIRETDLESFARNRDFARQMIHHPPLQSLWTDYQYEKDEHGQRIYKWGLSIDLGSCVGCNACVTACQAENNIPVVGKEQVRRMREMHWIRVDRYFTGPVDNPRVAAQPLTCAHCETAPCEQVCPVNATVHTHEGINSMVYNRCIGTRYCANNCPYKVRRFNWFHQHLKALRPENEVMRLAFNPEVTVRSRGVMEKCSLCIHRIQNAKIAAKNAGRTVQDGEVLTACQQACPTQAIVFGDLNDRNSAVARLHKDPRSYAMLSELNIKPRLQYLAKVTNPNPALRAKAKEDGASHDHSHH